MYHIRQLTRRTEIQAYLETDRAYAAYAIGDLDEEFFQKCAWHAAEQGGAIRALALVYAGFDPPVLFLMGAGDGVAALLGGPVQPARAYLTARAEHLAALGERYQWNRDEVWLMWRMTLRPADFRPAGGPCRRLAAGDIERLRALYRLGGGDAFGPTQVTQGVFYGVERNGQLIAAAGTHLVSARYGVAAVGNVMTHPDQRGQGYATQATSAVCAELVERGLATIVLNVRQDNAAAVRVYEKLGFTRHCPFYESVIQRKT